MHLKVQSATLQCIAVQCTWQCRLDSAMHLQVQCTFLDGYCSTVQGLLDWFEEDLGFTKLLFIQIDSCVLCAFVLKCNALDKCNALSWQCNAVQCTWQVQCTWECCLDSAMHLTVLMPIIHASQSCLDSTNPVLIIGISHSFMMRKCHTHHSSDARIIVLCMWSSTHEPIIGLFCKRAL